MKVILTIDVKKVGVRGQLITVADGYAMNVLIPQGKAVPGTADNLKKYEKAAAEAKGRADQGAAQARAVLAQIDGKTITITAKSSETGTLFKSLHESDIVTALKSELSVTVPESAVLLDHPIKQKGTHQVPISLDGSTATVVVSV